MIYLQRAVQNFLLPIQFRDRRNRIDWIRELRILAVFDTEKGLSETEKFTEFRRDREFGLKTFSISRISSKIKGLAHETVRPFIPGGGGGVGDAAEQVSRTVKRLRKIPRTLSPTIGRPHGEHAQFSIPPRDEFIQIRETPP